MSKEWLVLKGWDIRHFGRHNKREEIMMKRRWITKCSLRFLISSAFINKIFEDYTILPLIVWLLLVGGGGTRASRSSEAIEIGLWNRFLLCIPGWPQSHWDVLLLTSEPGLKAWTTVAWLCQSFKWCFYNFKVIWKPLAPSDSVNLLQFLDIWRDWGLSTKETVTGLVLKGLDYIIECN